MATSSWKTGTSGEWNTAADWNGPVPNSGATDALIDAPATTAYTVTIAAGSSDLVNSVTLNAASNLASVNQAPYKGAILEVDGVLTFAPGSKGSLDGPLQSIVLMNSGSIVNAGTVNAFVQAGGTSTFTGTNAIYFTNWLQSTGTTTVDTTSIAEYNASTKTLFDGIFEAKGSGSVLNLGGAVGKDILNVGTIVGPKPTLTPNFWTQVILDDPSSSINEWNGTAYVSLESTLTTIGESGIVTVTGNRNYTTANALTIQKDGTFEQTSGTLTAASLTIDNGGTLTNGVSGGGPNTMAASTDNGILTVGGNITNNGTIEAFPGAILLSGSVSGTGTLNFGKGGGSIEVNSVAVGQTVAMTGSDILTLDSVAGFKGAISASGTGNTIVLRGVTASKVSATNNSIQISNGNNVIDTITTTGSISNNLAVVTSGGNTFITIGGPAAPPVPPAVAPQTPVATPPLVTPTNNPLIQPSIITTNNNTLAPRIPTVPSTLPSSLITAALGLPQVPDFCYSGPAVAPPKNGFDLQVGSAVAEMPPINVSSAVGGRWDQPATSSVFTDWSVPSSVLSAFDISGK